MVYSAYDQNRSFITSCIFLLPHPPFLSVSFFIPFLTPCSHPFSEISLSFQLVIVQSAGCMRAENFITALLC
jgi:hypothetical protein